MTAQPFPLGPDWRTLADLIDGPHAAVQDPELQDLLYQRYLADHRLESYGQPLSLRAWTEARTEHRRLTATYRFLPHRSHDPRDQAEIAAHERRARDLERRLYVGGVL